MLDFIEKLFKTRDVYGILNDITKKDADDPRKLRSAYLRAALIYHPDKSTTTEKEVSTQKFQFLAKIYEVLKDDDNRKIYNETGGWPDEDSKNLDMALFSRLEEQTIVEFKKCYQGSDEELNDIRTLYEKHKGNIFQILDDLFFAEITEDMERVELIISSLIERESLIPYPKSRTYEAQKKRRLRKAEKEAAEAAALLQTIRSKRGIVRVDTEEDLSKAIMAKRGAQTKSFLDALGEKYSAMEQKKTKKPRRK